MLAAPTVHLGGLALTVLSLDEHRHVRDISNGHGVIDGQAYTGWVTTRAEFTARGEGPALKALLDELEDAERRSPQLKVEFRLLSSRPSSVAVTVRLNAAYRRGAFPVDGLMEALAGPAQPRTLPAPKQTLGMARWKD